MWSTRVLIVSDSQTFSDGLKSLLLSGPRVDIISQEGEVNQAISQIKKLKPDVVIWANTGLEHDAPGKEVHLLQSTPDVKTISLNLRNNELTTYYAGRKTVKLVQDVEDLIEAVKNSVSPPRRPVYRVKIFTLERQKEPGLEVHNAI
jgi:DNA-binding NarL/FixJ family response regulator